MRYFVDKILGRPYFALRLATQGGTLGSDQAYLSYLDGSLTLKARPRRLTQVILKSTSPPLDPSQIDSSDHNQAKQPASPQPSSPVSSKISYDVFICYSQADQDWIQARLLPDLKNEGLRVFDRYWDLEPGAPISEEFDRAILNSSKTLLVLTPAALKDDWIERAAQQVIYLDPAHRERRLLLLELEPCPLPRSVNFLVHVDFTNERYREAQFKRLVRAINYTPYTWVPRLVDRLVIQYPMITSTLVMVNTMLGLVAILTLVLVIFLIQPFPTSTPNPTMEPTGFNIAVAQFDTPGLPDLSQASLELSNWFYEGLRDQSIEKSGLHANFWGPEQVKVIAGEDFDTRAAKAKAFANPSSNVNLLIYGVITGSHGSYYVQPEFYVSEKGFSYASEIIGPNRLGQAVPITQSLKIDTTREWFTQELEPRRALLQYLVEGLKSFYLSEYENAFNFFNLASSEDEDQEVVHLLMGAAKLLQSEELTAKPGERSEVLVKAADEFSRAKELNKAYARSYLGLGAVALQQATIYNKDGTDIELVDLKRLEEAEYQYLTSLSPQVTDRPQLAYVDLKVDYALGQIYWLRYEFPVLNWSETQIQEYGTVARDHLEKVVNVPDLDKKPELTWFVGEAQALLCRLNGIDKEWGDMVTKCDEAIKTLMKVTPDTDRKWKVVARYSVWLACAHKKLEQFDQARAAYDQAIQIGRNYVSDKELQNWQILRENVEKGDSCREP